MALVGESGFPDRVLIFPGGHTVYVEVKGTGKKLSPRQELWRDRLLGLGCSWHLLDHTDDIPLLIEAESVHQVRLPGGIALRGGGFDVSLRFDGE